MAHLTRLMWQGFFGGLSALSLAVACSGSGDSFSSPPAGSERGSCRAGNDCDPGLVCLSNLCVNPDGDGGSSGGATASGGGKATAGTTASGGSAGSAGSTASGGSSGESSAGASAGGAAGSGVECNGSHPLVSEQPPRRYCAEGSCYCTTPSENCYTEDVAAACCEADLICSENGSLAGIDCSAKHPIIGPPRTCESGYCLCSKSDVIDACYPADVAQYCCPAGVELVCVP